jgi:hypothetical protein
LRLRPWGVVVGGRGVAGEGVGGDLGPQLVNLLVTHLRGAGTYEVLAQADVVTMIGVEQQRQLVGCDDASCMAELGGALGARWMVSGQVGKLGERRILTLKLLDVNNARIDNQMSKDLPAEDEALPEVMRATAYELLRLEAPVLEEPIYTRWWLWAIAGGVVVAGAVGVGLAVALQPDTLPSSNLGTVAF